MEYNGDNWFTLIASQKVFSFLFRIGAILMKEIREFTALVEREGDGYVALCPEFDIASQGDTVEEARCNLAEAVALFLETADPSEIKRREHAEVIVTRLEVPVG